MVALLVAVAVAVGFVVAFELAGVVRAWRHDRLLAWPVALPGGAAPAAAPLSTPAGGADAPLAVTGPASTFEELFAEIVGTTGGVASPSSESSSRPARQLEAEPDTDLVLQALIDRVARSRRDVAGAVSALIRGDHAELALFGADVPARPGRLSGFADLSDVERRRVIIRVLCLLLAQDASSDDEASDDDRAEDAASRTGDAERGAVLDLRREAVPVLDLVTPEAASAAVEAQWADVVGSDVVGSDEPPRLPQRRRLVRSAR
jgi:hypothetical protein